MENTVTLSQMADMIIVISFSAFVIVGLTYMIAEVVSGVIDLVKEHRRTRKERKAKKLEGKNEQAVSD